MRYCRIYLALLLHQLLKEPNTSQGVWKIADTFHCSRGFVQNVLHQSSSYVSCLVHFTEVRVVVKIIILQWTYFNLNSSHTTQLCSGSRLSHCELSLLMLCLQEIPELWPLKLLLPTLGQRLSYAVPVEAVPLMEVPGIKQV